MVAQLVCVPVHDEEAPDDLGQEHQGADDGDGRRGEPLLLRLRRWQRSPWAFPVVVAVLVVVLGTCKVSLSSVGVYAQKDGVVADDAGVAFGSPRGIRSDEWFVRTPWAVRQSSNDFATTVVAGVGRHQVALISELPISSWQTLTSPASLYYRVLDVERAVAFEWMTWLAVLAVGVYALIYAMTRRIGLAVFGGLVMVASPTAQWWTISATYTIIGYATLAGAALIRAVRSASSRRRWALTAVGGFLLACSTASMYLPWIIGVMVGLVPIVVVAMWQSVGPGVSWVDRVKRLAPVLLPAGAIAAVIFGAVLLSYSSVAEAMSSTIYPGERTNVEGGTVAPASLLGAPLDYFASRPGAATVNGLNQSENSSGLFLLLPAALGLFALAQRTSGSGEPDRDEPDPDGTGPDVLTGAMWASFATGALLGAWMWLPLPSWIGSFVGFNRVPAQRLMLPATLVGILAFVLVLAKLIRSGRSLSWGSAIFVGGVFAAVHGWAAGSYTIDGARPDLRIAAVLVVAVSIAIAAAFTRLRSFGLVAIAAFTVLLGLRINPVQIGLGPLLHNDLRVAMEEIGATDERASWAVFSEDFRVRGVMQSTGVPNVAGVSVYPNRGAWDVLDEEDDDEQQWNRFALVALLEADSEGNEIGFTVPAPDTVWVHISPCDDRLSELNVRFVVVPAASPSDCGVPLRDVSVAGTEFEVRDLEG